MRSCVGVTGATGYKKIGQRKANFGFLLDCEEEKKI